MQRKALLFAAAVALAAALVGAFLSAAAWWPVTFRIGPLDSDPPEEEPLFV